MFPAKLPTGVTVTVVGADEPRETAIELGEKARVKLAVVMVSVTVVLVAMEPEVPVTVIL
jgi:hypothetical protein